MTEEIRSSFGFDVSGALTSLSQLDAALKANQAAFQSLSSGISAFNATGTTVPATFAKISTAAKQTIGDLLGMTRAAQNAAAALAATKAQASLGLGAGAIPTAGGQNVNAMLGAGVPAAAKEAEQALVAAGNAGTKAGNSATLSWQTFGRIIQTQALIRGINMIRDAFEEAVRSYLAFSKQVSEIRAINPERSFGEISADIRKLSDSFNQPLSRVAEAQYQTISDQFVTAADRANILTAANDLAKTTNQDLADSAMLLTGALNAYGESSDMAGLRAAQFFKTIELGRLRMGELGTALGRIQGIASELGISMEELDAALVSITIGGVRATEAATQLRGIMAALLKPSDDMKKVFKEMGLASGEAGIATYGFQGFLVKLREHVNELPEEVAKIFRNVRALTGDLRLAGAGADKFTQALKAIETLDSNLLSKKLGQIKMTDAEKLTTEINKIKNALTVDVGADFTKQLSTLINLVGGAGIGGALTALVSQVPTVVAILGTLGAAFLLVRTRAFLMAEGVTAAGTRLLGLTALIPVARAVGESIGKALGSWARSDAEQSRRQLEIDLQEVKNHTAAKFRVKEREIDENMQVMRQAMLGASVIYQQDEENYAQTMKIEEQVTKKAFDNIAAMRGKLASELGSIATAAYKNIEDIAKKIDDIKAKSADRKFATDTGRFDPTSQVSLYSKEAERLANAAAKLTASAKDPNQMAAAEAMWGRADAATKTAEQLARQTGNTTSQYQIQKLQDALDQRRIRSLQQQAQLQAQLAPEAKDREYKVEQDSYDLAAKRLEIEKKLKDTGKDVTEGRKSNEQIKKDLQDVNTLIAQYISKVKESTEAAAKPFLGDTKAFKGMRDEISRQLGGVDIKQIQIAPSAAASAFENLQKSADRVKLRFGVEIDLMEAATGKKLEQTGLAKLQDLYTQQAKAKNKSEGADAEETAKQLRLRMEISKQEAALSKQIHPRETALFGQSALADMNEARVKLHDLEGALKRVATSGNITQNDLDGLQRTISKLNQEGTIDTATSTRLDAQNMKSKFDEQIRAVRELKESQDRVRNAAENVVPAINDQTSAVSGTINACAQLVQAWNQVEQAARAAASAGSGAGSMDAGGFDLSGGEQYASAGGLLHYFARGGSARGFDSIPAMLDRRGEFVMNHSSTQRFYSQLVAMNAGLNPSYRSTGGAVSNTGISGDVNVNINGSSQPHETGRAVINAINHELRRGTSRLRNLK